jgi:hypothetical protein
VRLVPAQHIEVASISAAGRQEVDSCAGSETRTYFALAVLGFSFWFFLAVPFASHRETYWWLAKVSSESFSYALSFIASTYRPLHQVTTWTAFHALDPSIFPTSALRQLLLQLLVYALFVLAWWLMFSTARHRRVLAVVACVVGGVFFSGYVHLFHVYGLSYVPVMLTLGILLRLWAAGTFAHHETTFAMVTVVLVLWHPFATALFVGFYFGHYLETFRLRSRRHHVQALVILGLGAGAVEFFVFGLPRLFPDTSALLVETATRSVDTRLLGFVVSYQTNEVNLIASFVACLLTLAAVATLPNPPALKATALIAASGLGTLFVSKGIPLVVLWLLAVLVKLFAMQQWSLFFLALTAALLPFGGGIGTPIHALFALIVATYATALAWPHANESLALVKRKYPNALIVTAVALALLTRAGVDVPGLTSVARPLLAERERTFQLESALAWLQTSEYCADTVGFIEEAGNPIESVESALSRQFRPPASATDVRLFWDTALRCRDSAQPTRQETAIVTFGGSTLPGATSVFELDGRYGGRATIWISGGAR